MAYSGAMLALMDRLVDALPRPLRRHVTAAQIHMLAQFVVFGIVGVIGLVVDTAVVYAIRGWAGLYLAGTLAYFVAVTTTWWFNRIWTFRGVATAVPLHRQWAAFFIVSLPGLCLNLGTYFALVTVVPLCVTYPVIAIAAGAVAGMFANFILSRAVVFR